MASAGFPRFAAGKLEARPGGGKNPQNDSGSPILYLLICPAGQETHRHPELGVGVRRKES